MNGRFDHNIIGCHPSWASSLPGRDSIYETVMENALLDIRGLKKEELPLIKNFTPPGWGDMGEIYRRHYEHDYFYPVIATIGDEIVGTGMVLTNKEAAWLGTIVVREEHRGKGIGGIITEQLIAYSYGRGIHTILLTASELGLPIYKKLGFAHDLNYVFFKTDNKAPVAFENGRISSITMDDYDPICRLDRAITGEDRRALLMDVFATGYKYIDTGIAGYYLPDLGKGVIVAENPNAGLELLKCKISKERSMVCVPEANLDAIGFLLSVGYTQDKIQPRMYLNQNVQWESKKIYSRGAGYFG